MVQDAPPFAPESAGYDDALTSARHALITHRLPLFAACWVATTTLWSAVLISERLLGVGVALLTVAVQCAGLAVAYQLCRMDRRGRRSAGILVATSVLLGVSSTAMFAAARGSGDVLAFVLLTLYLSAALFFAWGWRAQMMLWIATVIPWLAAAPFLGFAIRSIELGTAIAIGSVLSWAIAEGTHRTFRSAWIHRATEVRIRRELEASRDAAETATRAKDEFLATLSHELRSPLSAILTWTQLLRRGRVEAERVDHALEVIERSARLQARLIEDLLDVARIAAGKLHLEMIRVDLRELVRAAVDTLRGDADAKRIELVVAVGDVPLAARVDPIRVEQILHNLVANAVKFTPERGRVVVRAARVGRAVEIAVRDSGIGMSPEVMKRIFERFEQADSSIVRREGGLGLGLAIVRHLVALHDGTIEAESAGLGHGSTFRVRLPLDLAAAEPADDAARTRPPPLPSLEGLRVMVVDDERDARELYTTLLSGCGATVTAAASVAEAMQEVEAGLPDVLVADLAMPDEDGFALIRRLRHCEHAGATRMRAIAVTALAGSEDQHRAMRAGFDLYLAKPIEPEAVVAAVAGHAR